MARGKATKRMQKRMRKAERDAEYKQKVLAGLTPLQTPTTTAEEANMSSRKNQLAHEEALTRQGGSSEPTPPPVNTIITTGVDEHGDSSEFPALVYQTTDNHVTDLTEGDVYHKEPAQINLLARGASLDMHNSFSVLSVEDTPTDTIMEACPVSPDAAELAAMALQQSRSAAMGGKSILGITSGRSLLSAFQRSLKSARALALGGAAIVTTAAVMGLVVLPLAGALTAIDITAIASGGSSQPADRVITIADNCAITSQEAHSC
ncbi:hypothetical protein CVIRNUC_007191 [Coccomyxa viridis]|uniref:Uncharacterized protein n=1 Tax=Coccomyxa viridis TaxID=1274662 RepID=A0AAV1IDL3_9CHLO|nr:hypothetical protein CVIRNUC_007191 [Coccomyxa viridis]